MGRRLLTALALWSSRRYGLAFLAAALLGLLSLGLSTRLRFDTDVLHLLPQDMPEVRLFVETLEQFGAMDVLLVAVRIPEATGVEPYEAFAEGLGQRLAARAELSDVRWGLGDPRDLLRAFLPKAMLFLDDEGRRLVEQRLADAAIAGRVRELRRQLSTPQAGALKDWLKLDPLGLSEAFLGRLAGGGGPLRADWMSGFFLSSDRRMLLIVARPVRPAQDIDFVRRMVAGVEEDVGAEQAEWRGWTGDGGPAPPEVGLGGGHIIALSDASKIQSEIIFNVATSLGGVLLLFWICFRRWGGLVYPLLPLACGIVLTFGFSAVAFGVLSAATSGVAAMLIGLGIDLVIVIYGRYAEERRQGVAHVEATGRAASEAGWSVTMGAVTTAATFYAFCLTDFRGLRQMGLLTGTGILLCLISVFVLLPAMLAWSEARQRVRTRVPRQLLYAFGVERLMAWSRRHPRPILVGAALLTAAAAAVVPRIGFEEAMASMRPKGGNPGVKVQEEVGRHFGSGFEQMQVVIDAATAEEVIALSDRAARAAQALVGGGVLVGVDAINSIVPPPAGQASALRWLEEGRRSGTLDPARVEARFEAALAAEGLRAEPFRPGLDLLGAALSARVPLRREDLAEGEAGQRLVERYLRPRGAGWRGVVYLYPPLRRWKTQAPPEVLALVDTLGPQARLTGPNVVSHVLRAQVRKDAALASALGLALVVLLLWLDYREPRGVVLSLLPLSLGVVWMFGTMAALGIDMNFMNIFVTTMVIGIGTDYGVHLVHRHRETRGLSDEAAGVAQGETGKAVLLAALTTIVGFGSLSLSSYPGLASMGIVAALGTLFSCLAAVTVLPALFSLRRRGRV